MLSVFPELLTYHMFAPFLLRVVLGVISINLGYLILTSERRRWVTSLETLRLRPAETWVSGLGLVYITGALMLIAGIWTQVAALVFAVIFSAEAYLEAREDLFFTRSVVFYLLLAVISISLLLTGAGMYAIDMPL